MLSGFVSAICRVGVFMICAQTIVHFRPKASYEKYLKMLVSAMILMQLFASATGLFGEGSGEELFNRVQQLAGQLEDSIQQASKLSFLTEEGNSFPMLGEPIGEKEEEGMRKIEDISVRIGNISPIQIEGNAEKKE